MTRDSAPRNSDPPLSIYTLSLPLRRPDLFFIPPLFFSAPGVVLFCPASSSLISLIQPRIVSRPSNMATKAAFKRVSASSMDELNTV